MASTRARSRKGMFAILGAFFVVLTVVIALVWFLGVYQTVFRVSAAENRYERGLEQAQGFKERLLLCHEKTFLLEQKLQSGVCTPAGGVAGYRVMQDAGLGCAQKSWSVGATTNPDMTSHIYWMVVQQDDGRTCLARLFIYQ